MTKETTINSVSSKPSVILTRKLPESIETRMRELFDARLNEDDTPYSQKQLSFILVLIPEWLETTIDCNTKNP